MSSENQVPAEPNSDLNNSHNPLLIKGHTPVLDGFRGMALFYVMLYHMSMYNNHLKDPGLFDYGWLTFLLLGWTSVDMFFVLSGFLITGILLRAKSKPRFFQNFYARRCLRIFPLFYLFLILLFVFGPLMPERDYFIPLYSRDVQWWESLMIFGYFANFVDGFFGQPIFWLQHFWTLSIEEQFYFVWPAFIYWLNRRQLINVCIFLILSAPMFRYLHLSHDHEGNYQFVYVMTHTRWDAIAAGSLLAMLAPNPAFVAFARRWFPILTTAGIVIAIIASAFVVVPHLNSNEIVPYHALLLKVFWYQVLGFSLSSLTYTMFLGWLLIGPPAWLKGIMESELMQWFGRYSYGMYVFHWPMIWVTYCILNRPQNPEWLRFPTSFIGNVPIWIVLFLLTALSGYLSMHLFEKHFLKLKKFF